MNLNPEVIAPVAKANDTVWDLIQSANKNKTDQISKGSKRVNQDCL